MLQNIRMKCCEVKPTSETCRPSDAWVLVRSCDNISGVDGLKCEVVYTVGITMKESTTLTKTEMHSIMAEASVSVGAGFKVLGIGVKTEFTASAGGGFTSGYDWSKEDSKTFSSTVETSTSIMIPKGTRAFVYQLVGTCGIYSVRSSKIFRGDTKSRKASVKPYLVPDGFFCDSQSSVVMKPTTESGSRIFNKANPFP